MKQYLVALNRLIDIDPDGSQPQFLFVVLQLLWNKLIPHLAVVIMRGHLKYFIIRLHRKIVFDHGAYFCPQRCKQHSTFFLNFAMQTRRMSFAFV